jgi:DNA-binding transcriptional LysR family regulator
MGRQSAATWDSRIGRRIRLRDLHVLLAVVQCGSMAGAARQLCVSQPAVSKAIADLEHTIGRRLVDRNPHGIEATLYGRTLVRRALTTFDELHQAVDELEFLANPTRGEARIGCNESLAAALLPAVVERLSAKHPGLTLHAVQMSRPINIEIRHLRERTVDLILGRGIFPVPEDDLNAEILFEERLVLVAGVQSRWARQRRLELDELIDAKWILYPPHEAPATVVEEAFRMRGLGIPRPVLTASSFHVRDALLAQGDYLTVVPSCMVRAFNAKRRTVKVLPVDLGIQKRPVAMFTLRGRTLNPVAEIVTSCIRVAAARQYETSARN